MVVIDLDNEKKSLGFSSVTQVTEAKTAGRLLTAAIGVGPVQALWNRMVVGPGRARPQAR